MKDSLELRGINFEEGYIAVLDKPLRWTSTDVVRKIKFSLRKLGYRRIKVGHAGTLDPLATGILLVCIGRATKMVDALAQTLVDWIPPAWGHWSSARCTRRPAAGPPGWSCCSFYSSPR